MKKISYLLVVFTLLIASCSKDSDDSKPIAGEIKNIEWSKSSTGITISWNSYSEAQSYQIYINGVAVSETPVTTTSLTINSLEDGTSIKVEAYSDSEATEIIAEGTLVYVKPEISIPDKIESLEVSEVEATQVKLTWENPSTEFSGIEIYLEEKTETSVAIDTLQAVDIDSIIITDLTPETEYTFYIYTYNVDDNEYAYSEPTTVTVTTSKKVTEIGISDYKYNGSYGGSIQINVLIVAADLFENESEWQSPGDLILEIYSADSINGEFTLANTNDYIYPDWNYNQIIDMYSYKSDMNYIDGNTYYLKVVAKDKNGNIIGETAIQEVEFTEPASADIIPGVPTNVNVSKSGDCVTITWDTAENAVSYRVYVSTTSSMSYATKVGETSDTTIQDCDRGSNVKMYYQVKAVSSTGNIKSSTSVEIWL